MKVLIKEPLYKPRTINTPNDLHLLQELVGGYIEAVTLAPGLVILCNEDGRALGLPHNCTVDGIEFVGTILCVGAEGDDFTDCPLVAEVFGKLCVE